MTIKELNQLADSELKIRVVYSGSSEPLNRYETSLQMLAYGDYEIAVVTIVNDNTLEAQIKTIPVKAE